MADRRPTWGLNKPLAAQALGSGLAIRHGTALRSGIAIIQISSKHAAIRGMANHMTFLKEIGVRVKLS